MSSSPERDGGEAALEGGSCEYGSSDIARLEEEASDDAERVRFKFLPRCVGVDGGDCFGDAAGDGRLFIKKEGREVIRDGAKESNDRKVFPETRTRSHSHSRRLLGPPSLSFLSSRVMNKLPAELLYFVIYNPELKPTGIVQPDDEDASEQAHILFYTAKNHAVSKDRVLRQVGLAKAMTNFTTSVKSSVYS